MKIEKIGYKKREEGEDLKKSENALGYKRIYIKKKR